MRAFCFKCNRITIGFRGKDRQIELKCGCKIKPKDIEKQRVFQKTRYFLKDGREIIKTPQEQVRYELRGEIE